MTTVVIAPSESLDTTALELTRRGLRFARSETEQQYRRWHAHSALTHQLPSVLGNVLGWSVAIIGWRWSSVDLAASFEIAVGCATAAVLVALARLVLVRRPGLLSWVLPSAALSISFPTLPVLLARAGRPLPPPASIKDAGAGTPVREMVLACLAEDPKSRPRARSVCEALGVLAIKQALAFRRGLTCGEAYDVLIGRILVGASRSRHWPLPIRRGRGRARLRCRAGARSRAVGIRIPGRRACGPGRSGSGSQAVGRRSRLDGVKLPCRRSPSRPIGITLPCRRATIPGHRDHAPMPPGNDPRPSGSRSQAAGQRSQAIGITLPCRRATIPGHRDHAPMPPGNAPRPSGSRSQPVGQRSQAIGITLPARRDHDPGRSGP
jgi:hypothetical protein